MTLAFKKSKIVKKAKLKNQINKMKKKRFQVRKAKIKKAQIWKKSKILQNKIIKEIRLKKMVIFC